MLRAVCAREGRWHDMYDVTALKQAVAERVPAADGIVPAPVYPPQVAIVFAPWARLPYLTARWLWFTLCAITYLIGAGIVIHMTMASEHRVLAWLTAACNPALAMALTTGQLSAVAVLVWAFASVALASGFAAIWRILSGAARLQAISPWRCPARPPGHADVGCAGRRARFNGGAGCRHSRRLGHGALARVRQINRRASSGTYYLTDTLPHQKQSLLGFFQLLTSSGTVALLFATVSAIMVLSLWLTQRPSAAARWYIPMLASSSVLLSPHLYVYDLAVLTPGLIITAGALSSVPRSRIRDTISGSGYALLYRIVFGGFGRVPGHTTVHNCPRRFLRCRTCPVAV